MDATGDGIEDVVSIHIQSKNWQSPINWTLEITSKGKKIFIHKSDDTWMDQNFNDEGFVNDTCPNYLECKKQYYLQVLPKDNVVSETISPNVYGKSIPNGTTVVAKEELMAKFKLTEQEAEETVEWMVSKLKSGPVPILNIKVSPVQNHFPKMYVEKVNDFVVIYQW